MLHLQDQWRDDSHAYWMGYQYAENVPWPVEKPAWTAAAAILAMIPLSRSNFWGPMAVAIMGGLFVATVLNITNQDYGPLGWGLLVGLFLLYPHLQYCRACWSARRAEATS